MSYPLNENIFLSHCQTEAKIETFSYTWQIPNFWEVYPMIFPIQYTEVKQPDFFFELRSNIIDNSLQLYVKRTRRLLYKYFYEVSILCKPSISGSSATLDFQTNSYEKLLFTIKICDLLEEKIKYVPNDIFTIYFVCKCCSIKSEVTMHTTMHINYKESETQENETQENEIQENETQKNENDVPDKMSLVIFIIGDKRLYANKNLICEKSPVLKAMFNCHMKEGLTNEVEITDIKYDILKLILTYMQFNLLSNLKLNNIETLSELFIAADKYDISDLKLLCEFRLIKLVDTNNFITFFNIVWLDNTKYLKNYLQEFWQMNSINIFNKLETLLETNSESLPLATRYTENAIVYYDSKIEKKTF